MLCITVLDHIFRGPKLLSSYAMKRTEESFCHFYVNNAITMVIHINFDGAQDFPSKYSSFHNQSKHVTDW